MKSKLSHRKCPVLALHLAPGTKCPALQLLKDTRVKRENNFLASGSRPRPKALRRRAGQVGSQAPDPSRGHQGRRPLLRQTRGPPPGPAAGPPDGSSSWCPVCYHFPWLQLWRLLGLVKGLPGRTRLPRAGDLRAAGSIPGSGRSPGGGHATHSRILAWRIPQTEEPGGLQPMGSTESDTTEAA